MAGVLNLRNVLELVIDGFDDGALAQKELIFQVHEAVLHIFAEFGDQLQMLVIEQFLKNRFGDVAPVAKQLAKQMLGELGQRHSVIHIACGQISGQQLTAVIDHHMQFETIEPAHRVLAPFGYTSKNLVGGDTRVVADTDRRRIDKTDAATATQLCLQVAP